MSDGTVRMPRLPEADPPTIAVPHPETLAGGSTLPCSATRAGTRQDCRVTDSPHTYFTLRDSLWYPHAVAFRAIALADTYFLFRGMLSASQRDAWLRAIRETGDGLALPSSYEPDQNHGITESAALIQLASD